MGHQVSGRHKLGWICQAEQALTESKASMESKPLTDSKALREVAEELRQLVDNLLDTIDSPEDQHHQGHGFR
tara:strand:- start:511 stop:726 length:216 start_codon:yes stop_codon:yes gene_type:complete